MAKTSEVKVLRLKVGDFIIAKVSELKDKYTMEKPMALGFVGAGESGQGTLQFAPWFPFTDSREINIAKDDVLLIEEPGLDLLNHYNKNFGSGLIQTPKGLITE
tara:strand:- start:1607 stop:1918 length:312 start_codon:yes stop_codon:yes gene_type:complete